MRAADIPPLDRLGRRIMICGPSCSGKSTLAATLGARLTLPVVHLDQLRFVPGSDWRKRTDADFDALHEAAIESDSWIIEGNYRQHVPARLARATGVIELITGSVPVRLWRYARRTLFEPNRSGGLAGNRDSIKWAMVRWIAITEPQRRPAHMATLRASGLPLVEARSLADLRLLGKAWELSTARKVGPP